MKRASVAALSFAFTFAFCFACGAPASAPAPPVAASAAPSGSVTPAPAPPPVAKPEAARYVVDWELACVAGADGKKDHNECHIETLTKLSDDAFFFGGSFYGSAHVGSHILKKGAFEAALAGVVDRAGTVKWTKSLGLSWHNEISRAVALDAHHVLFTGSHGPAFHPSLPHRAVTIGRGRNGGPEEMGWKAEESLVGVMSDEGKLEWVKNLLDIVGAPWNQDLGSPDPTALESDGAGGAFCTADWQNQTRYRIHFDVKGNAEIVSRSPSPPAAPLKTPYPVEPPNRRLWSWHDQTNALGTWRLLVDNPKANKPDVDEKPNSLWSQSTENVLWYAGPTGTWNANLGRGEWRGEPALLVADDGVAFVTAPRTRAEPPYGTFSEVSLFRVEANGTIAWASPLWGLTLPASQQNRVDAYFTHVDDHGEIRIDAMYYEGVNVANLPLPLPTNMSRGARVTITIAADTGAVKRVEWLEAPRGCVKNAVFARGEKHVDLSPTEQVVAGVVYGDWDTAACGEATGSASMVAKLTRAP